MSQVHALLDRLELVRPAGTARWTARCPAHKDRDPSLSVAVNDAGMILVHCHAGCGAADVVGAVGLRLTDLYPEPLGHHYPSTAPRGARDVWREAKYRDQVVSVFKRSGRILHEDILKDWAATFVKILDEDVKAGRTIVAEDLATLEKINNIDWGKK